jgi:6-pyruvoyltetrahydropterin/6-carboxytetrahydropterin synthase
MNTYTITRRFEIDAGHRLVNHPGKCNNYHGHRYTFDVELTGDLQRNGMVVDFGDVKKLLGDWLDENWDHGMILERGDPFIVQMSMFQTKVYTLPFPPTAERLAGYFYGQAKQLLKDLPVWLVSVTCYETPKCWARSSEID